MGISICDVHVNPQGKEERKYAGDEFPVACFEDDMEQLSVPVHWHDEYEYIIVTEGTVELLVNGEHITLSKGQGIFFNSGCLHGVRTVDYTSMLRSLVILPKLISGNVESSIYQRTVRPLALANAPAYITLAEGNEWQQEIAGHMMAAWDAINAETYDFENEARFEISRAIRILADHMEQTGDSKANEARFDRVKQAILYIEQNYAHDISNQDLEQLLGCSESALLRNFKQAVGTSPMQYLLDYRLKRAAELLVTTSMRSGDIALACGFNDFSYFTKQFKCHMGKTPGDYRNCL